MRHAGYWIGVSDKVGPLIFHESAQADVALTRVRLWIVGRREAAVFEKATIRVGLRAATPEDGLDLDQLIRDLRGGYRTLHRNFQDHLWEDEEDQWDTDEEERELLMEMGLDPDDPDYSELAPHGMSGASDDENDEDES